MAVKIDYNVVSVGLDTSQLEEGKVYRVIEKSEYKIIFQELEYHELSYEPRHGIEVLGNFKLDHDKHTVVNLKGEEVIMTSTEWKCLLLLTARPNQLVTFSSLLTNGWGLEYRGEIQYLRVWVSRLRVKLEGKEHGSSGAHNLKHFDRNNSCIYVVSKNGYVFNPDYTEKVNG